MAQRQDLPSGDSASPRGGHTLDSVLGARRLHALRLGHSRGQATTAPKALGGSCAARWSFGGCVKQITSYTVEQNFKKGTLREYIRKPKQTHKEFLRLLEDPEKSTLVKTQRVLFPQSGVLLLF